MYGLANSVGNNEIHRTKLIITLVYMLNMDMQFENVEREISAIKLARFDVQDVIVADMEVFDDIELGLILVDPAGKTRSELTYLLNPLRVTVLQSSWILRG